MNLIPCDQHCQHQQDGYCSLNQISSLTNQIGAKCGYFQAPGKQAAEKKARQKAADPFGRRP